MTRDYWGEPSGEPRPDYRDAVEPDVPIEHEGKPARGERVEHTRAWLDYWKAATDDED